LPRRSSVRLRRGANAQEALDLVWQEAWDVVILDLSMPGRSGLDILKEIKRARPKLPVLILSMHPEDQLPSGCSRPARRAT
jgi:DNA-binding NarL/FixJ family response regulator